MSSVVFGSSFSFITAATPSTGWIIGFDLDGVLKQKSSSGVIISVGGGPTAGNLATYSLAQVLTIGNNTNGSSIIMGTSTFIRSTNGGGKLELDYLGLTNSILLSTDNSGQNEHGLILQNGYVALFSNGYKQALELDNGNGDLSIYNISGMGSVLLGVATGSGLPYTEIDEIKISNNSFTFSTTGNYDKQGIFIGTRNSNISTGVVNSVVIGGQNMTASNSNSIYTPNIYIQNGKGIRSQETNEVFFLNDSSGYVVLDRNSGFYDTSWFVFAPGLNTRKEWIELGVNSDIGYGTASSILIYNSKGPTYSWQRYSAISLEKNKLELEAKDLDVSGDQFILTLEPELNQATLTGPVATFKGLEYNDDYSLNFVTHSLVDKNYVDSQLLSPDLSDVLTSGNDSGVNDIIMGTNTVIKSSNGGGQIDLDFSGSSNMVLISTDNGALSQAYIQLDGTDIEIESPSNLYLTINSSSITTGDSEGLKYSSTYDATFVTSSLITKGYTDIGTSSIWNYLQFAPTASGVSNYVPKWSNTNHLSSTSSIYISEFVSENSFISKSVGSSPLDLEFDSFNNYIYVANSATDNVSIIDSQNLQTIGTVSVGDYPISMAWDSFNNRIYVANQDSDNVSVIDTLTNTISATISVGNFPTGVAFDGINNLIFVSNQMGGSVSVIDTSTNTITSTIPLTTPRSLVHDFNNGYIWVTGVGPDFVAKIDTSTLTVAGTVSVGTNPYGAAYDSFNDRIYITNYISNNVSVIDVTTDVVIATVSVSLNPDGIEYDPENKRMYVACGGSGFVSVIDTLTNTVSSTIVVNFSPREFTYDSINARMIVSNFTNNSIQIIETITKSDFIGINTDLPTSDLDVRGKITTENLKISNGANTGYTLVSDQTGNANWQYPIVEVNGGNGLTGGGTSGFITLDVELEENSGLTFSGSNELTIDPILVSTGLQGNGLTANSGFLDVNVGNGLSIESDVVVLGGTLSQTTTIVADSNYFAIDNASNVSIIAGSQLIDLPPLAIPPLVFIHSGSISNNSELYLQESAGGLITNYGSTYTAVSTDQSSSYLQVSGIGFVNNFKLLVNPISVSDFSVNNYFVIEDNISNKGLVYDGDYTANFTDNSLVTKAYVDSLGNSIGATNGLVEYSSGIIGIGGTISQSTIIDTDNYNFGIENFNNLSFTGSMIDIQLNDGMFLVDVNSGNIDLYGGDVTIFATGSVDITTTNEFTLTTGTGSISTSNLEGLVYTSDYSATFVSNSLVNKAYVDSIVSAVGATNGLTEYSPGIVGLGGTLSQNILIESAGFDYTMGNLNIVSITASNGADVKVESGVPDAENKLQITNVISSLKSGDVATFSVIKTTYNDSSLNSESNGIANSIRVTNDSQTLGGIDGSSGNYLLVKDNISNKGLVYEGDYTANFTTYSLVTKAYVDSSLSTATSKYTNTRSFTAGVTETITHSLGTDEIIVQLYDSSGVMVIPGTVQINGVNAVDITLSVSITNIKTVVIG